MPKPSRDRARHALADYRRKRRAGGTPEPFGAGAVPSPRHAPMFVVQQHRARALHFDLRLELGGVLKSWAVPKGPSANPADKRFARLVEDHPIDYADFEGSIPDGNYGAGWVIVWDRGTYRALNDLEAGLDEGKLLFEMNGGKLRGRWTLVRMKSPQDWLLIKEQDEAAREPGDDFPADSVLSGLTLDELPQRDAIARRFAARVRRLKDTRAAPQHGEVTPMLASAGEAFDHADWIFELKYDGYRLIAHREGDSVMLISRNGLSLDAAFPEIAHAVASLPCEHLVIDGEIVVHDATGRPSFSALQQRAGLSAPQEVAAAARHLPATLYAFDLPAAAGRDLRPLALTRRKALLAEVLPSCGTVRYSEHVRQAGRATFAAAQRLGVEGIVAKRAAAPYRGGRSKDWIKVRLTRSDDFVVVGWSPVKGQRRDVGALAIGEYRQGTLCYVGKVGSGLKGAERAELEVLLAALPAAEPLTDAADVHWVTPQLVCEVAYREYTTQGHLRQPVFLRRRDDKAPQECVGRFDDPQPAAPQPRPPRDVEVSNRDKVFFPEAALTKGDLVEYYRRIAPWMLPYLADRPLVLTRFPDGIHGKRFYQRDAPDFVPDWIERHVLWSESAEREVHYFVANDADALAYLANLGTIPIHTWHSRTTDLAHPDWCVLDLDPKGAPFEAVIEVARAVRDLAEEIELPAYPKTSGASGLHVLIPLGGQLTHDQAKTLGELLATVITGRLPERATITRAVRRREGKVYVDYLQNGHGKLLVAPFSARAEPAASVSMPLRWHEVKRGLGNERFTLKNAMQRMQRLREDPLREVLTAKPDLHGALARLLALVEAT